MKITGIKCVPITGILSSLSFLLNLAPDEALSYPKHAFSLGSGRYPLFCKEVMACSTRLVPWLRGGARACYVFSGILSQNVRGTAQCFIECRRLDSTFYWRVPAF